MADLKIYQLFSYTDFARKSFPLADPSVISTQNSYNCLLQHIHVSCIATKSWRKKSSYYMMMIYLENSGSSVKSAWFFVLCKQEGFKFLCNKSPKSSQFANILSPPPLRRRNRKVKGLSPFGIRSWSFLVVRRAFIVLGKGLGLFFCVSYKHERKEQTYLLQQSHIFKNLV